ncbi:MAG: GH1 family beta-glucosidase [Bacteroidetes bacterium]|nr:GH1 family beta-glucosidase [Bacteroidota bacterium]MDA1120306.1 GH1 family beta-glucosidase [Bacteroidota bacterium]
MIYSIDDFGEDFYWGVSTAAYQIEGGMNEGGKGLSIWDEFVKNKNKIKDGSNGNDACNHYHTFESDIEIIDQLNIPNYRFSISWSRLLPNGTRKVNQQGIDFYNRLIDACLEKGITPWVTLYHWDLPLALEQKGGWTSREMLNWFEDYVNLCARNFGDRVKHWMVLNEPMVFTGAGYFLAYHAPGRKGLSNFIPAMHHATLCQGIGGRILRNEVYKAKIGTTFSCSHIDPYGDTQNDITTAKRFDALLNRLFIEPTIGLGYPVRDLPLVQRVEDYMKADDDSMMIFEFDFIGIQNYTHEVVKHSYLIPYLKGQIVNADERNVPITTMNWEVYPSAIYHILKKFGKYDKIKELIVTENGAAFEDSVISGKIRDLDRIQFIQSYLDAVLRVKNEGVKVTGYFIWTLLDNFEWAEGYTQRFGLVYTDFITNQRIIKDSGYWYYRFLNSSKVRCLVQK